MWSKIGENEDQRYCVKHKPMSALSVNRLFILPILFSLFNFLIPGSYINISLGRAGVVLICNNSSPVMKYANMKHVNAIIF